MKITDISIKRPSLVIVVFTALTLLGLLSYFSLGYELLPKFSPNVVSISTIYPGASPNEVESTVTKKIEDAVSSMENIKKINANSYESLSVVIITLTDKAEIELNEKKDGYYITFNNIEWSENEGALDDDGEQIDKEIVLPTTVQGVLYKNEITIQNTGNAMNYYVKIGECDLKFIHLIRQ